MPRASSSTLLPALCALTNATVWGIAWLPLKFLESQGLPSLWTTLLVFAACTAGVLIWSPGALAKVWRMPVLAWLALAAGLTNVCFNVALATGDVVRCVLLFYLMPMWVVPLARWLLHEPITPAALLRLSLALAGAILVLGRGEAVVPWPQSAPDWLALAGGAAFALNNVLLRRLADAPHDARSLAMFSGAVVCAPLGLLALGSMGQLPAFAPQPQAWAVLAGFTFAVLIANLALQYGAARLRANTLSLLMLSEILVASLSSWLAGEARLDSVTLAGGALIVAASVLAVLASGGRRDSAQP